ncbi:MAG: prepilin-type cleavage/methylation domain-containing protein [Cyanobacteria bacterium J06638_7]
MSASCRRCCRQPCRGGRGGGFSLVELLVTLLLSGLVLTVVLQLLVGDLRQVGRLGRWLRERQAGERTLALLREELQRAEWVSVGAAGAPLPAGCALAGRAPVLLLQGRTAGGTPAAVLYTYGPAPSAIWRGAVLMRCGPAYGLDGGWSEGSPVARVLIDALPAAGGFAVTGSAPGVLRLELERQLADGQTIRQQQVALGAGPPPPGPPAP